MRMKITWLAEHRGSVNTICTAPAQDCERSENPISCPYIRHHRYDIVATSLWCCVKCVIHHEQDVPEEQHHTYMWRKQAIKE